MTTPQNNPFWTSVDETLITLVQFYFEEQKNREALAAAVTRVMAHVEKNYPRNPGKHKLVERIRKLGIWYWKQLSEATDVNP